MKLPKDYKIRPFKNCAEVKLFVCENDPDVDFLSLAVKASPKISYILYHHGIVVGVSLAQVVQNSDQEFYECIDDSVAINAREAFRFKICEKRIRADVFTHAPINN